MEALHSAPQGAARAEATASKPADIPSVLDRNVTRPDIPRPSLNILPPEIREIVWKNTFPPARTLQVEVHACRITNRNKNQSGLHPPLCVVDPEAGNRSRSYIFVITDLTHDNQREWKDENSGDAPPPLPPTALYVCQESRIVAQKSYQVAFRPRTLKSPRSKKELVVSQERNVGLPTWVDFNNDTFVFDRVLQFFNGQCLGIRGIRPTVADACGEEMAKIRNLALRCPLSRINDPYQHISEGFPRTYANKLIHFGSLATLRVLDLSLESWTHGYILFRWQRWGIGHFWLPPVLDQAGFPRDLTDEIVTLLKSHKESALDEQKEWKAEIPEVKVGGGPNETFEEYRDWNREGILILEGHRSRGDEFGNPSVARLSGPDTRFL